MGLDRTLCGPQLKGRELLKPDGVTTGDDAPELGIVGMAIGCGRGTRFPLGVRGANNEGWESRRYETDGDTARRFAEG